MFLEKADTRNSRGPRGQTQACVFQGYATERQHRNIVAAGLVKCIDARGGGVRGLSFFKYRGKNGEIGTLSRGPAHIGRAVAGNPDHKVSSLRCKVASKCGRRD